MQTHVGRAVAVKDGWEHRELNEVSGSTTWSFDIRKSAMYVRTETEPCVWPAGFIEWAFPAPKPPTQPRAVRKTPVVVGMTRQYLEDTVLPWRFASLAPDMST